MKSFLVRLLALVLIAGGIVGLGKWRFERVYYESAFFTFSGATQKQLDEVFNEAVNQPGIYNITRDAGAAGRLDFHVEALSWQTANELRTKMSGEITRAARKRKLESNSRGSGNRYFQEQRYPVGIKLRFIASAGVIVFGLALMILSLRIFGGGSREAETPA